MYTLVYGNGFNRLSKDSVSWNELLKKIHPLLESTENIPYTVIYEQILLERPAELPNILKDEEGLKISIAELLAKFKTNEFYEHLLELALPNYLTTNYEHSLQSTFKEKFNGIINDNSTEDVYSIRRNFSCIQDGVDYCKIWHMHGDVSHPKSIMLGLDQYCGSVGKIDNYIKGKYDLTVNGEKIKPVRIEEKLKSGNFDPYSWIDLFFSTHVYIIGLSLEFSEIDLWWILNKRARLLKDRLIDRNRNSIVFYSKGENVERVKLIESFGITVKQGKANQSYEDFYMSAIRDIKSKVGKWK